MLRKFLITLTMASATLMAASTAQARDHVSISFGFYVPATDYVHNAPPVVYRTTPRFVRYEPMHYYHDQQRHHWYGDSHHGHNRHWHQRHGRGHASGHGWGHDRHHRE